MKIYITFGQIHTHSINGKTFDRNCVALIEAEDHNAGRKIAFEHFSDKWHQSLEDKDITDEFMSYFPRGLINI